MNDANIHGHVDANYRQSAILARMCVCMFDICIHLKFNKQTNKQNHNKTELHEHQFSLA